MASATTTKPAATGAPPDHGGRLNAARQRFPDAPKPWIDFSTGINPVSYPISTIDPACFALLPEPEAQSELETIAVAAYGAADPALVVAAPGTQCLINLLPRLFSMPSVAILGPTYAEHQIAWARAGARVSCITTLDDMAGHDSLVLCNPNNPDGRMIPPDRLRAIADRLVERSGLLVVDEAFMDFTPKTSLAPYLPHPAIIVLRSFGKAYGLAGLRLGFALSDSVRAATIREALGPWAVSGPALAIGTQALADGAWLAETRTRLERDCRRLDDGLNRAGLHVTGGTLLFRYVETRNAKRWFEHFGSAGILVRQFGAWPDRLRFGLPGDDAAWARLNAALSSGMK